MVITVTLMASFVLGFLGLLILGYRTNKCEPHVPKSTEDKDFVEPTWNASKEYFLNLLKGMAADLGYLVIIVIIVFSTVGFFFFLLSLMPYSWLKKFTR